MSLQPTRRGFLAAAGFAAVAGCLGGADPSSSSESPSAAHEAATTTRSSTSTRSPAATRTPSGDSSPPPLADASLPLPKGPAELKGAMVKGCFGGKDCIPAIDHPSFTSADAANEFLDPGDPVFGLERNGVVKAYPQRILVWHEICNDTIDGEPVSVTYCPLTGTVLGFERGQSTFGVSGRLINNNLVMYDRATDTTWPQVLATAIPGPWSERFTGRSLREFRLVWTTWKRWRETHPGTQVLSTRTNTARNYDRDPYGSYNPRGGYYATVASPMFEPLSNDDRYEPKRVFIGARTPDGAVAFLKDALRERKLITGSLGGTPALAVYEPSLDTGYVYLNPAESSWTYRDGMAVGPNGDTHDSAALPLTGVHAFDAMWFAWIGFYPESTVYG